MSFTKKRPREDSLVETSSFKRRGKTLKPSKCNKYCYMIAHGEYNKYEDKFAVPPYLRLIRYSNPRKLLCYTDAYFIIKQLAKIDKDDTIKVNTKISGLKPPPILKSKLEYGTYYLPNNAEMNMYNKDEPNTLISNMELNFDGTDFEATPYFRLHYTLPDGTVEYMKGKTDLKTVLNRINNRYIAECLDKNKQPKIINVVILACHKGSYTTVTELTKDFGSLSFKEKPFDCKTTDDLLRKTYSSNNELSKYFSWLEKNFIPIYIKYDTSTQLNRIRKKYCGVRMEVDSTVQKTKSKKKSPILETPMEIDENL